MADPRFTSKFSARYTSDVIVRDVAEAINVILAKMGDPKIFLYWRFNRLSWNIQVGLG